MNNTINCYLSNITYCEKNKFYEFNKFNKNINDLNGSSIIHKMIICPKQTICGDKINIQFKIYTMFIKSIEFIDKNKIIHKFTNIHPDGFLFSFDFNNEFDKIEILVYPDNANAKLFIKDKNVNFYEINNLNSVKWDNIFIINLKRRSDRKNSMVKKILKQGIKKYEFIDAIDGLKPEISNKFIELKKSSKTKIISVGHFACLLSHIKSIQLAKERKYKSIMILEDDVYFCENFISKLNNLRIPLYDMIYLGGIIKEKKVLFNKWSKSNNILGAYGYILTSNLYDVILNELTKQIDCVDLFYMKQIQSNYNIILLDDFIKTNLETSDTSEKSFIMKRRLSYIK